MARKKLRIVGKLLLKDCWNNPQTLLVRLGEDQGIYYSLSGTISRIAFCTSNLGLKRPLPDVMLDYKSVDGMMTDVVSIVRECNQTILSCKTYE